MPAKGKNTEKSKMKWYETILLAGILSFLLVSTCFAQKEFPISILFDSVKILPPATVIHFTTDYVLTGKDEENVKLEISHYLDNRFSLGLAAGYSSLKVVPDWGAEDLTPKLPRISMKETLLRFGWRAYLGESLSALLEATIGMSKGCLHYNYFDPNTIISSSGNPLKYKSGDRLHIKEDVNVTNTIVGGSVGFSSPLYFRSNPGKFFLLPRAILFNFKVGTDILILRADNNEIPYIGYSKSLEGGYTQSGAISGEILTVGDWVLFYLGFGIDYMIGRNFIFKIDAMIGAYPVSGPATVENGQVTASGPPDTWGGKRAIRFGFEILL